MEPQHDNPAGNPGGGDFLNRPHEPLLHPILHPLTLAQFYGKHHEAAAVADAREALDLATRFCREAQVCGLDTYTDAGFDWGLTPSRFSNRISVELGQGGHAALLQVDPDLSAHPLDAAIHAGVLGHKPLASAYALLPAEQREGLLRELRESIDQVQSNRSAAKQLQALRAQPELPQAVPALPHLDIARLLQRYEVPDAQARLAADHVKATYREALTTMHGSRVLAAAHAHAPHLGLYGAPWQTWLCENATTGNLEGVEACLRMQAEPNVPDANGETPLHLAARHGHPGIVRRLIEAGADPALGNPRGETPLHVAAQHKRAQCCLELMAAGADPGQLDREGRKPGDAHREKALEQVHGL
ncbi:ankyrin repeat domain-containing protein [Stenotrophomonas maltophilia]|uniref:ankyrin repeat domain-containing protein n=1 Tax=Stenotrophomonas maltophilia TaxID=40324 RepID=UPI001FA6FECF|nr:ankyrin repeat domain-containing protein [Stenotrophomonas maltophilia]